MGPNEAEKYAEQVGAFVGACHKCGRYGLSKCSSGNLSFRVDDEHILISASRSWLSDITAEQVAVCRLSDGECVNGPRPSVETGMHIGVLKAVAGFDVVLHFQSPAATAVACGRFDKYYFDVLPEIPYYIGKVSNVPFAMPGSAELAGSVVDAMADGAGMVILQNHGLVTAGRDYDEAIQRAVFFEMACDVLLRQKDIVGLSEEQVKQIRDSKKV